MSASHTFRRAPSLTPVADAIPCSECRVAQEADHRITNHLAMLASYVRLKAGETLAGEGALDRRAAALMLQSIRAQILTVARVHRGLIFPDGEAPDLVRHIREACEPFEATLPPGVRLALAIEGQVLVAPRQVLPLTQIVAEALTNAIKHAFPQGSGGEIAIRCGADLDRIRLEIADNGVGMPDGFDPVRQGGYGVRLIAGLVRQLRGDLAYESDGAGTRVRITAPRLDGLEAQKPS